MKYLLSLSVLALIACQQPKEEAVVVQPEEPVVGLIAEKAMANISEELSEKLMNIFNAAIDGVSDKEQAEKYETSEASIRVYRHRVKNALLKEIIRLNKELDS